MLHDDDDEEPFKISGVLQSVSTMSPEAPNLPKTLTWSLTLRCTAGRSPRSSDVAGRDRSAASPLSSMEGSARSRTG